MNTRVDTDLRRVTRGGRWSKAKKAKKAEKAGVVAFRVGSGGTRKRVAECRNHAGEASWRSSVE